MRKSGGSMVLIFSMLVFGATAKADTYSWVDNDGVAHFTDNYSNIPPKQLNKVKVREDSGQSPSYQSPSHPEPEPKDKRKPASPNATTGQTAGIPVRNTTPPSTETGVGSRNTDHDRNDRSRRQRGEHHNGARHSQHGYYDSQSQARKGMDEAQAKINQAKSVGQDAINKAHQEQQKAQDLINKSRYSTTPR